MESKEKPAASSGKWRQIIPNALTIARIILVPIFIALMIMQHLRGSVSLLMVSLVVFCVASYTDHLDGKLARRWKVVSDFGKLVDPIADKALMISAFVLLSLFQNLWWWFTAVVILREVAVTLLRMYLLRSGVVLPASKGGKIKTSLQILMVFLWMLAGICYPFNTQVGVVRIRATRLSPKKILPSPVKAGKQPPLKSGRKKLPVLWSPDLKPIPNRVPVRIRWMLRKPGNREQSPLLAGQRIESRKLRRLRRQLPPPLRKRRKGRSRPSQTTAPSSLPGAPAGRRKHERPREKQSLREREMIENPIRGGKSLICRRSALAPRLVPTLNQQGKALSPKQLSRCTGKPLDLP